MPSTERAKPAPRVHGTARRGDAATTFRPSARNLRGLHRRRWWALLNHSYDLPVIFRTRQEARDNRDPDEYLMQVLVEPVRWQDLPHFKGAPRRQGGR